jgi:prephenate dehydratase
MAEEIRLVDYFYVEAPDKPGEAFRALSQLREAGVNLLAFSGFPKGRRSQLDFIPEDPATFRAAAKKARWKLVGPKKGFLIQGEDRVGAMADLLAKLAEAKINVTATDAVCAGAGRFGVLLWVKPRDVKRAAKAFGIG